MAIVTLRPNQFVQSGGWVARLDGAPDSTVPADYVTATSDDSDTTYIAPPRGVMGTMVLGFTTVSAPARAQWRWIRPSVRAQVFQREDGWVLVGGRLSVFLPSTGAHEHHPDVRYYHIPPQIDRTYYSKFPTRPNGDVWKQSDINDIRWRMSRTESADQDTPWFNEWYLEAEYNEAPVVTLTGPATPVTDTSSPTLTWTYADPELDPQERYHAIVYPEAIYSQAGFTVPPPDPVTNPSGENFPSGDVWRVGPVATTQTSVKTDPLPKGNYEAWVFAADAGSNPVRYSAGSSHRFTIDPAAPPVATITAEVE